MGSESFCDEVSLLEVHKGRAPSLIITFLLASPPYRYSSLIINLFAFISIAGIYIGPLFARYISNRSPPLYSVFLANLVRIIIDTYTGTSTVGGPTLQAFAIGLGLQMSQIAQRSAIQEIAPSARNETNTARIHG